MSMRQMDSSPQRADTFSPSRIQTRRWTAKLASLFVSSRAISSGIFVVLIVVTDHCVIAADQYMNRNVSNSYDPLVIASAESLLMLLGMVLVYVLLNRYGYVDHADWTQRANWRELTAIGFLAGAEASFWAMSSKGVSTQYAEAFTALLILIAFVIRYAFFEVHHLFHISGAVYAAIGLLAMAFSVRPLVRWNREDYYYAAEVVMWGLVLVCFADYFGKYKLMPIAGVCSAVFVGRFACTTATMLALVGAGVVNASTFGCLFVGHGCAGAVPATLLGHAVAQLVRFCSCAVVVKYVGAPLCAMTLVTSASLRFYTHPSVNSVEIGASALSFIGCAVFLHGQWILEVSHNEEWGDHLRRSLASTSLVESSSDDDNGSGPVHDAPLLMNDGDE